MEATTLALVEKALAGHEVRHVAFHVSPCGAGPRRPSDRSSGFWVPIAYCQCGHTSPLESRTKHLTSVLSGVP